VNRLDVPLILLLAILVVVLLLLFGVGVDAH